MSAPAHRLTAGIQAHGMRRRRCRLGSLALGVGPLLVTRTPVRESAKTRLEAHQHDAWRRNETETRMERAERCRENAADNELGRKKKDAEK